MRLSITDLLPGTEYAIQVRSDDGTLQSEWSPVFEYTTMHDIVLPKTPTNVVWSSVGDAFYAEWDSVTVNNNEEYSAITRYEIEFTGNSVTKVVSVPQSTEPRSNYTLTFEENKSLFGSPAATVAMRVRAVDNKDLKSNWSATVSASNPVPLPPASASTTPGTGNIAVSWSPSPSDDVVSYNVYFGTSASFTPGSGNRIYTGNATSMIFTTSITSTFYFKIRAVDKFGQESADVSTSGAANPPLGLDTTPPGPPTGVTTTTGFDIDIQRPWIKISWTAPSDTDIDKYEIRWSDDNINYQYMFVGRDVTEARIGNLSPNKSYYVSIRAVDFSGNSSTWARSATNYPLAVAADTSAPSTPAAPTASVGAQRIQVTVSGLKNGGGAMESDVAYYQVFASTTNNFTPSNANMLGIIQQGPAMIETFQIPASSSTPSATSETWYVKVKAVDRSGNVSASASPQATAAVGLILTANIGDAQITNAKINDLAANKITAGTGFINDLTVKSKFTLGDASTDGIIESYDYGTSGGTTGFRLAKSGLVIKTGAIEAAALKIQDSNNLIHPAFALFDANPNIYFGIPHGAGSDVFVDSTGGVFNGGKLRVDVTTSGVTNVILQSDQVPFLTTFAEGEQYIFSFYAWRNTPGTTSVNTSTKIYDDNNDVVDGESVGEVYVNTTTPKRYYVNWSGALTGSIAETRLGFEFLLTGSGTVNFSGLQIERQVAGKYEPSPWRPPSWTTINGGQIRTGEIRSNQEVEINSQVQPTWFIDLNGAALFSSLVIRGETTVGLSGEDSGNDDVGQAGSVIHSANYSSGESGWAIYSNGLAEFRSIVLGSLDGSAIKENSLRAEAIESGSVLAGEVTVTGNLHALGEMGEDIGLSGDGFLVLGPYEVNIVSIGVSGSPSIATITTAIQHGFSVGQKLVLVNMPDTYSRFNGTYSITNITDFTVSFSVPDEPAFSPVPVSGVAKSMSNNPAITRPTLIEFPTDGANPNIISGQLKADHLTVLRSGSIMGPTSLENTTFTIASGVVPPKSAPVATVVYDTKPFTGGPLPVGAANYGITQDASGNYYIFGKDSNNYYIARYNSSGAYQNTLISKPISVTVPQQVIYDRSGPIYLRPYTDTWYPRGIFYSTSFNRFYVTYTTIKTYPAWKNPGTGVNYAASQDKSENIVSYSSLSNAGWERDYTGWATLSDAGADNGWRGTTVGWDYVGNRPMHVLSINSVAPTVRYPTINATGDLTGTWSAAVTLNQMIGMVDPRFVCKVNTSHVPEFGGERIVIKELNGQGATGTYANNLNRWTVIDTATGNPVVNEAWPTVNNGHIWGGFFDPTLKRFFGFAGQNALYKYEADDSYWKTDSNMTKTRPVAYAWYDSKPQSTFNITQKQISSGILVTLTTSTAHGLSGVDVSSGGDVGRWVEIEGVGTPYDGWAKITAIPNTTSFQYVLSSAATNVGPIAATGTMKYRTHESNLSPSNNVSFPKRGKIKVDITDIPYFETGEYPDKARIYMAESNTLGAVYYRRLVLDYPARSGFILPGIALSGGQPMPNGENGFAVINNPSKITNTSGSLTIDGSGLVISNNPAIGLYQNATQNITSGTSWTRISLAVDASIPRRGNNGAINSSIEVKQAGYYMVSGYFSMSPSNATGRRGITIGKFNTSTPSVPTPNIAQNFVPANNTVTTGAFNLSAAGLIYAEPGEYFSLWAYQDSGATMTVQSGYLRAVMIA